eukprot:g31499.t1
MFRIMPRCCCCCTVFVAFFPENATVLYKHLAKQEKFKFDIKRREKKLKETKAYRASASFAQPSLHTNNSPECVADKSIMSETGAKGDKNQGFAPEQMNEFQEAFGIIGKGGIEKQLDAGEISTIMRSFGINPTLDEINSMIKQQGDEKMSFDSFLKIMAKDVKPQDPETIIDAFKVFDRDNTGVVTATELRLLIASECELLNQEQIEDLIRQADLAGDGNIKYK